MKRFAKLDNNKVVAVFTLPGLPADADIANQLIDITGDVPKVGAVYDPVTHTFTGGGPVIRVITKYSFRSRMTLAEKIAIKTSNDPVIQVFEDDLRDSSSVNLDLPALIDGLGYLASPDVGILSASRVTELLQDGTPDEAAPGAR